jgi:hypothetical protein
LFLEKVIYEEELVIGKIREIVRVIWIIKF